VHKRCVYLTAQLGLVVALDEMRLAKYDDSVWQLAHAVSTAFGQSKSVVQTEQIQTAVLGAILDDEHDVVETVHHVIGQSIEFVDDELFEGRSIHFHHRPAYCPPTANGPRAEALRRREKA